MPDDKETKKKPAKKKTTAKTSASTKKKAEDKPKASEPRVFPDADDRITCTICGHSTPRMLATSVGADKYVCSARCLAKYGKSHQGLRHS